MQHAPTHAHPQAPALIKVEDKEWREKKKKKNACMHAHHTLCLYMQTCTVKNVSHIQTNA